MDLEATLDYLVEVVVSYPPATSLWLVNLIASITVASQKNEDDHLYFSTVKLRVLPNMYRKQQENILSRRLIEEILRILTLSLEISGILSQLFYIRHNVDYVPYMSLVSKPLGRAFLWSLMLKRSSRGYPVSLMQHLRMTLRTISDSIYLIT
ncbi:hypothetical protein DVH24_000134 [Malus domestica]|uniref:Uncharacterized protein n=1 Tax=Malus domestica TaxID=3750 RepID=A0A498J1K1_MALDO|nr:hypothetical protein DVH24_000134 [Malus domestica]